MKPPLSLFHEKEKKMSFSNRDDLILIFLFIVLFFSIYKTFEGYNKVKECESRLSTQTKEKPFIYSDLPKPIATVIITDLKVDKTCLPYQNIIAEEFYELGKRTCLINKTKDFKFMCPLNYSEDNLGRFYQIQINNLTKGIIAINVPNRHTVAHEFFHIYQYFCAQNKFNLSDNRVVEGTADLYADTRIQNSCLSSYEDYDWLKKDLNEEQKIFLMNKIFETQDFVNYKWLLKEKNGIS